MTNLDAPLEVEEVETSETQTTSDSIATPQMVDVEMSKFFGFMPGDSIDIADKDYMQTIWNYYAEGTKTSGEVIRKISSAERGIAPPMPGESRLGKLYTYVRLLEESKGLNDEIQSYRK